MVPDRIEREIVIEASVERVWAMVTEAEHLGTWFGDAGAEVDLREGGSIVLRWREHGTARGVIERVDRPRVFAIRWALPFDEEPRPGNSTRVVFTLVPEGDDRTRLTVVESGFRSLDVSEEEKARHVEQNTSGWRSELDQLRDYAERQPT
jgi:uncharacterized protein YndB with AHSA1/START domain